MTAGSLFSIGVFVLALLGLFGLLVYMWLPNRFPHNCQWSKISIEFWTCIGDTFVGSAIIYAVLTFWRVLSHVDLAKGSGVDPQFNLELTGYAAFWIFVPPLWFYIDYFAIASRFICGIDTDEL